MKFYKYNLLLSFVLLIGCKKSAPSEIINFNILEDYPIETLYIQDIADVEYLALKTHDDYLFSSFSSLSENFVICYNSIEYSLVFFNRKTGEPVSKVSRYGNGPEEYTRIVVFVYSEEKDELFILDYPIGIKVYGKDGTFKRQFPFRDGSYPGGPEALYDYDDDNLLFYDLFQGNQNNYPSAFVLLSKQDGHITKEIDIPYTKKVDLMFIENSEGVMVGAMPDTYYAVRNNANFLLTDYSTDTVYWFTPEYELIPMLVRTPSIHTMNTKVILHSWLDTNDYLFFSTEKLEYDWKVLKGFPSDGYLMEKHSGKFFQADVRMKDYNGKVLLLGPSVLSRSLRNSQTGVIVLPTLELLNANKEKKLNGKLKEKVDLLAEDDEFLLMILKFK